MLKDDKLNRLVNAESFDVALLRQNDSASPDMVHAKIVSQNGMLDEVDTARVTGLSKNAKRKAARYGKKPLTADELAEIRQTGCATTNDDRVSRRRANVSRQHETFAKGYIVVPRVYSPRLSAKQVADYCKTEPVINPEYADVPNELRIKGLRTQRPRTK